MAPSSRSSSRWRTPIRRSRPTTVRARAPRRDHRHRPLRLPEPGEQRARLPVHLPRRARRARAQDQRGDEAGRGARARRAGAARRGGARGGARRLPGRRASTSARATSSRSRSTRACCSTSRPRSRRPRWRAASRGRRSISWTTASASSERLGEIVEPLAAPGWPPRRDSAHALAWTPPRPATRSTIRSRCARAKRRERTHRSARSTTRRSSSAASCSSARCAAAASTRVRVQHAKGRMTVFERIKVLTDREPNLLWQNWGQGLDGASIVTGHPRRSAAATSRSTATTSRCAPARWTPPTAPSSRA